MRATSKVALMVSIGLIALILGLFAEEFSVIAGFMQELAESNLAGTPRP